MNTGQGVKVLSRASGVSSNFEEVIAQEREFIQSESVLSNAVCRYFPLEQTNLDKEGFDILMAKVIAKLRSQIEVRQVPNAKILEIIATDQTPELAAKTADAIALSYKISKHDEWRAGAVAATAELQRQLEAQDRTIKTSTEALQLLKDKLQVSAAEIRSLNGNTNSSECDQVERNLNEAKKVRELLAQKLRDSEAYKTGPTFSMVEIMETARPPRSPSGRKKLAGMFLIAVGVGCCGWGLKVG